MENIEKDITVIAESYNEGQEYLCPKQDYSLQILVSEKDASELRPESKPLVNVSTSLDNIFVHDFESNFHAWKRNSKLLSLIDFKQFNNSHVYSFGESVKWALYRSCTSIRGEALSIFISRNASTLPLYCRSIYSSVCELAKIINKDLFTGDGEVQLKGLDKSLPDNCHIVSKTQLCFKDIKSDIRRTEADLAVVSENTFNRICSLYNPSKEHIFHTVSEFKGKNIPGIIIDGCTIIDDKDCPDNKIYYLDTKKISIKYLISHEKLGDESRQMLGIHFESLAKLRDADTFMAKIYCQLSFEKDSESSFLIRSFI